MPKKAIPDPLRRRHELERDLDASRFLATARAYLEVDRPLEAVAFLAKANAQDELAKLRDRAVKEGDVFLLRAVCEALEETPDAATWRAVAEAATSAGKERYAVEARRQAGRLET